MLENNKDDIIPSNNETLIIPIPFSIKPKTKPFLMNYQAIDIFRKALDKAIKIATVKNIPPIKGVTIILCPTGQEMRKSFGKFSSAKKIMTSEMFVSRVVLVKLFYTL